MNTFLNYNIKNNLTINMTSKEVKRFRRAKKRLNRRKQRKKMLKFIFTKLIFFSLLKNILQKIIKYLTIIYFASALCLLKKKKRNPIA